MKRYLMIVLTSLFLITWTQAYALVTYEVAKLKASDGALYDEFGNSVSISGDYAIVGAYKDDDNVTNSGSAYIFERNGSSWTEVAKLKASDGAGFKLFGKSVSISGNYAIVGSNDNDNAFNSGSAYIFERNGDSWTEVAKLKASDGASQDEFGNSVSISGDYVIVGAYYDDDNGIDSGSAYIFERNGSSWTEVAKLKASDGAAGDTFGNSVSISGDYVIVGAYYDDDGGESSGSAYIFERNSSNWAEVSKLNASEGLSGDQFGNSVSISGDYAIVGAYRDDDDSGEDSGSAYIFEKNESSWTETAKLAINDGAINDGAELFGSSVSISGDYAIVGSYWGDGNINGTGSAYLYEKNGNSWTEVSKLNASDGHSEDTFGVGVSITGNHAIVGAVGDDDSGNWSGSAYVFEGFSIEDGYASISGKVVDSQTGNGITGVTVTVSGATSGQTTTSSTGDFSFLDVPAGSYTITATKSGYIEVSQEVTVQAGESVTVTLSLTSIGGGEYRIVLTWGETPKDLDSHLWVPDGSGCYNVYWDDKGSQNSPPYTQLDIDKTDSFGPETITIYQSQPGTYEYWVHRYSDTPDLTTSNAVVKVYDDQDLLRTFTVPTSPTGKNGWHVFDLNAISGSITVVNNLDDIGNGSCSSTPTCSYSITPTNKTFAYTGGSQTIQVTADDSCPWTATESLDWVNITSGSSGSGNGTVSYSVSSNNSSSSRTGSITIAGKTHMITQSGISCSYSISPTNGSFSSTGGTGSVSVTSQSGCPWTASESLTWVTITSGSSGSGNGTVSYSVSSNNSSSSRTGSITIAGKTHMITQSGISCSYSISPTNGSFSSTGGTGSVSVTSQSGCPWTASESLTWVTITSGSSGSGNGTVLYSVSANTSTNSRSGSITIAGKTFTFSQSGMPVVGPTLGESLDNTTLQWTTSGNSDWVGQTIINHDGIDAAKSGVINDSQVSSLETSVTGLCKLSFYWKISSEANCDFLIFFIDDIAQSGGISGEVDWQQMTFLIPEGTHTLKWEYIKDYSVSSGSDCSWLDLVVFDFSSRAMPWIPLLLLD